MQEIAIINLLVPHLSFPDGVDGRIHNIETGSKVDDNSEPPAHDKLALVILSKVSASRSEALT
jgi:hypothetical protein